MSAGKEISIEKLGIIAGSGTLPRDLYQRCLELGIECHVIGFKAHTNYITPDFWGNIGKASKIRNYLKENEIHDVVFIGAIKRPNLWSLRPDWFAIKFFLKAWLESFGDSNVLSSARKELESLGIHLHGIHKFLPALLLPQGIISHTKPNKAMQGDILIGVKEAREWGAQDKGQAVIVKDGEIIAREGKAGTSKMIELYGEKGAILVKMCKPQQDHDMDLPTIGPRTVELCAMKEMAGIVGQATHTLVAEQEEVIKLANANNIFLLGQEVTDG